MLLTVEEVGNENVFDKIESNMSRKAAVPKNPSSLAKIKLMGFIVSKKFHSKNFDKFLLTLGLHMLPGQMDLLEYRKEIVETTCDLLHKILPETGKFKYIPLLMLTLLNRCHI